MTFTITSVAKRSSAEAIKAANKRPAFTYSDALTVFSFCPPEVWELADSWLDRLAERK